jgi:hypothetical protein
MSVEFGWYSFISTGRTDISTDIWSYYYMYSYTGEGHIGILALLICILRNEIYAYHFNVLEELSNR